MKTVLVVGVCLVWAGNLCAQGDPTQRPAPPTRPESVRSAVTPAAPSSPVVRLRPAPADFTSSPKGDLFLDGHSPYPAYGAQLGAHADAPNIFARLGNADSSSSFTVVDVNNAELMRVGGDGRIRIGKVTTTNPFPKVDIETGASERFAVGSAAGGFGFSAPLLDAMDDAANLLPMVYNATKHIFWSGSVGIGTLGPVSELDVSDGTRHTWLQPRTAENGTGLKAGIDLASYGAYKLNLAGDISGGGTGGGVSLSYYNNSAGSWNSAVDIKNAVGMGNLLLMQDGGNVGIGTALPVSKLDVSDGTRHTWLQPRTLENGTGLKAGIDLASYGAYKLNLAGDISGGGTSGGVSLSYYNNSAGSWNSAVDIKNAVGIGNLLLMQDGGNVGIGTSSNPSSQLVVNGSINASGSIIGGTVRATFQDLAEWVPSSGDVPPGTVVILNPERNNEVMPSSDAYDTRVAGVVSGRPGLLLGEAGASKAIIATTGRVKVRVDATKHAIHIGDLLVTSDTSGAAMVSQPLDFGGVKIHRPGTLIGKALEPLSSGNGEILVLLSLQ